MTITHCYWFSNFTVSCFSSFITIVNLITESIKAQILLVIFDNGFCIFNLLLYFLCFAYPAMVLSTLQNKINVFLLCYQFTEFFLNVHRSYISHQNIHLDIYLEVWLLVCIEFVWGNFPFFFFFSYYSLILSICLRNRLPSITIL